MRYYSLIKYYPILHENQNKPQKTLTNTIVKTFAQIILFILFFLFGLLASYIREYNITYDELLNPIKQQNKLHRQYQWKNNNFHYNGHIIGKVINIEYNQYSNSYILNNVVFLNDITDNYNDNSTSNSKVKHDTKNKNFTHENYQITLHIKHKLTKNHDPINIGDKIKANVYLNPLPENILPYSYNPKFYKNTQKIYKTGGINYTINNKSKKYKNRKKHKNYAIIKKAKSNENWKINLRDKTYKQLINVAGEKYGGFIAAILISQTKAIPNYIRESIRSSGISHILCVSGLHLSMVSILFFHFFSRLLAVTNIYVFRYYLNDKYVNIIALLCTMFFSFIYLLLNNFNTAAARAFIMSLSFLIGSISNNAYNQMKILLISASVILAFTPEYIFNPSFQLSFSAIFSLICAGKILQKFPKLKKYIYNYNYEQYDHTILYPTNNTSSKYQFLTVIGKYFASILYSTLMISIITTPMILFHFYNFYSYGFFANMIAIPLMSFIIMPFSLVIILLIPFNLHYPLLFINNKAIDVIIYISNIINKLNYNVIQIGHIPPYFITLFLISILCFKMIKHKIKYIFVFLIIYSILHFIHYKYYDNNHFYFNKDRNITFIFNPKKQELEIYANKKIGRITYQNILSYYGITKNQVKILYGKLDA